MDEILKSMMGSGPLGAVLAFVMWKLDQRMEKQEAATRAVQDEFWKGHREVADAIDRLNTASILRWISAPDIHPAVKQAATELIEQNKTALDARNDLTKEAGK